MHGNINPLENLMRLLSGLPGLGNRSARRIALHLLSKKDSLMMPLSYALSDVAQNVKSCHICGNLDMIDPCNICINQKRNNTQICVVASISDVWAIERTGAFKGRYHVLGGLLCALDGVAPDDLRIAQLVTRIKDNADKLDEVILALSATVDGQSTAHYISDHISRLGVKVSHLSHGVPVGGELDYLDDGTIITALRARS